MINSPSKQVCKKFDSIIKNFEFSSLKKEFNFSFPSPSLQLMQSSNKKIFFERDNFDNININNNNEIKGEKNIRQKLENEFDNVKEKNQSYPIVFTVNDEFLDMLINIYSDKDSLSIDNSIKKNESTESENNNSNTVKKITYDNKVLNNNNSNEQITCICLKSNCNNNYCSCHKNNSFCNENCRCLNCKNKGEKKENNLNNQKINNSKGKNICRCKNTKCSSFYCECKKNSLLCSKDCLCMNCENI